MSSMPLRASLLGALMLAAPLSAQSIDPQCAKASSYQQDACQKTVDLFQLMAPQLATAVAGGNATLGEGGTLGGLGHFTIEARGNVVRGYAPEFNNSTLVALGAQQSTFKTTQIAIPAALVDGGLGLFKGIPVGITHVGGIDVLGSAFYAPNYTGHGITVRPDRAIELGYGARLGIVDETRLTPALSATFMERDLPTMTINGFDNSGDTLRVKDLSIKTASWLVVASKNILLLGLAAGVGEDHDKSSTDIAAQGTLIPGLTYSDNLASPTQSMTRTNYFGDVSLNFPLIKFIAEVGGVSERLIATYNTFAGTHAGAALLYGSVGVRLKI
jgi:hypothetical protein